MGINRKKQAEFLKKRILEIKKNNEYEFDDKMRITIFLEYGLFIEMASCFIDKYGK